jgi:hypothetical protein
MCQEANRAKLGIWLSRIELHILWEHQCENLIGSPFRRRPKIRTKLLRKASVGKPGDGTQARLHSAWVNATQSVVRKDRVCAKKPKEPRSESSALAKQNRTSHPVGASRRELDRLPISSQTQNSHKIASQGMRRQARRRNPSKAAQSLGQKPPRSAFTDRDMDGDHLGGDLARVAATGKLLGEPLWHCLGGRQALSVAPISWPCGTL